MKYSFNWDETTQIATCVITDPHTNMTFTGTAKAHPDDREYANNFAGSTIAESRANIKYYKYVKNNVLTPKLAALKQLYYSINQSNQYNDNSYEAKMIKRQIKIAECDIENIKKVIKEETEFIDYYIHKKDKLYRKWKDKAKSNQEN